MAERERERLNGAMFTSVQVDVASLTFVMALPDVSYRSLSF